MNANKVIKYGFGILLLTMAVTQLIGFSFFYHTMRTYLLPVGERVKPLEFFVLPLTLLFMSMHAAGAIGILLLSDDNEMRINFAAVGLAAMIVWAILIFSIFLRGAPIAFVGFFGQKMRQSVSWITLAQSILFVLWGYGAYCITKEE